MIDKETWFRASEFQHQFISKRAFSLADTGLSHRLITYWDEKGLMIGERDKASWRKFTFEELIWIRMIAKLRQFNVGIETILEIKNELFRKISLLDYLDHPAVRKKFEDELSGQLNEAEIRAELAKPSKKLIAASEKTHFELFLMQVYSNQQNLSLIFTLNPDPKNKKKTSLIGMSVYTPELLNDIENAKIALEVFNSSFISVSLGELVSACLSHIHPDKIPVGLSNLTQDQQTIIHLMRTGDYKEVNVRDKESSELKVIQPGEVNAGKVEIEVVDIIYKGEYFDIEVIAKDGKKHYAKGNKYKKKKE